MRHNYKEKAVPKEMIEIEILVAVAADGDHAVSAAADDYEGALAGIKDTNQPIEFMRIKLKVPKPEARDLTIEVKPKADSDLSADSATVKPDTPG